MKIFYCVYAYSKVNVIPRGRRTDAGLSSCQFNFSRVEIIEHAACLTKKGDGF